MNTLKMNGIDQTIYGPFQPIYGTSDTDLPLYQIAEGQVSRRALKDFWVVSKRIGYPLAHIVRARPDTGDDLTVKEDVQFFVHTPVMIKGVPDNLRILSQYGCTDLPMSMLIRAGGEVYLSTRQGDIRPPKMQPFPFEEAARLWSVG